MAEGNAMNIDDLLSRLQKVKRSGVDQWMACCPAHDDNHPSLSIRDAGNGKILVNCLAGCGSLDVIGALGLDYSDLMPEKLISQREKPIRQRVYPSDALRAIQFEARVVIATAFALNKGEKLPQSDLDRLKLSMERINTALEVMG
jgi:hypothetical protein